MKHYGIFGGQYVPPELKEYLNELENAYRRISKEKSFKEELRRLLKEYVGRPSPLYKAEKLSQRVGCSVYLKREDLNHTGAHKINNTLGQGLLAKRMGKKELIAETGAGQHGVATATVAALLGMRCKIFMGVVDVKKQAPNVQRMRLLGAEVHEVTQGGGVLKDAVDAAIGYLLEHPETFYLLGSAVGPHPYPEMVASFQRVIGEEAKRQILEAEGRLPDRLVACVGGGSNAIGLFGAFLDDEVHLIAVEPAGKGNALGEHAATLLKGTPGVIHGFKCLLLQDGKGEPAPVYSIASGLDYPGVGPQLSMLKAKGRLECASVSDKEALAAFAMLCEEEGIIPALESSHAIAYLLKEQFSPEEVVVMNLSGRGDKDLETVLELRGKG